MPYELKPRDIERRLFTCEKAAASKPENERFFASYRDWPWVYYDNPKHRRSWGKPGHA